MYTVCKFSILVFCEVDMELHWEGKGVEEKSIDVKTNKALVEVNLKYFCPFAVE